MFNPNDFYITDEEYAIALNNGISKKVVDYRVRVAAWNKSEAITKKTRSHRSIPNDILKLAESNGICYKTLISRINKFGDMKLAATKPVVKADGNIRKAIQKRRKYSKEMIELAKSNGISDKCFYQRIKKYKWDEKKAATVPVMTPQEARKLADDRMSRRIFDAIFQKH